jgi:hypothetical protein
MKRWYDKNEKVAKQLDALIKAPSETKLKIIKGLLDIIQENADQEIVSRFKVPLDIDLWSRRDYDDEAATWIVINNLKYVDEKILDQVADFIEKEI